MTDIDIVARISTYINKKTKKQYYYSCVPNLYGGLRACICDYIFTESCGCNYLDINYQDIIGSDHGLSPGRRQAMIWTNAGMLLIGPFGTNFSEILMEIYIFSFKKMDLKMSSDIWRPFCLGLNVLTHFGPTTPCGVIAFGQHWLG